MSSPRVVDGPAGGQAAGAGVRRADGRALVPAAPPGLRYGQHRGAGGAGAGADLFYEVGLVTDGIAFDDLEAEAGDQRRDGLH